MSDADWNLTSDVQPFTAFTNPVPEKHHRDLRINIFSWSIDRWDTLQYLKQVLWTSHCSRHAIKNVWRFAPMWPSMKGCCSAKQKHHAMIDHHPYAFATRFFCLFPIPKFPTWLMWINGPWLNYLSRGRKPTTVSYCLHLVLQFNPCNL
jgi:hypothetical protein